MERSAGDSASRRATVGAEARAAPPPAAAPNPARTALVDDVLAAIARRDVPDALEALGDAIRAALEEISAVSSDGDAPGDADDDRRRLLAALVRQPATPPQELRALARAAGWSAGATVAALAAADERPERLAARLPAGTLIAAPAAGGTELVWAVVPDAAAPGRLAELRARLHDRRAALGPAVAFERAAESARLARLALMLGADRPPALVVAADHRVDLLLLAEPLLAGALADAALAPLAALPAAAGARLLETLEAWLRHRGAASAVAEELHVHAQTVRYRLGRLRTLLGARMETAEGLLELELALRARRLAAGAAGTAGAALAAPGPRS